MLEGLLCGERIIACIYTRLLTSTRRLCSSFKGWGVKTQIWQQLILTQFGFPATNLQYFANNCLSRLVTKPTKWHVRPAKTQISLGIRPGWSPPSLCAQWVAKDPSGQRKLWSDWADAQADLSLRWAHMPFCWFCQFTLILTFRPQAFNKMQKDDILTYSQPF